jgi:hypothetical protein
VPWHQFIDAILWPSVNQAGQQIGEIRLGIDAIEFTGLCRPPNYAEGFRNDT